jgi:hypothetical protein
MFYYKSIHILKSKLHLMDCFLLILLSIILDMNRSPVHITNTTTLWCFCRRI